MTGFEYGNARLRYMKSRLLSRSELEGLTESDSLQGLIAALTRTAYRKSVETALTRWLGMECISEALHAELISLLGKIRSFYSGTPGEMVAIVLRAYDIHNLKTILRGISTNAPAAEILASLLPVGAIDHRLWAELANLQDVRAVIDVIASQGLPLAQPLLRLRAGRTAFSLFEMELALDQWHIHEALRFAKTKLRGKNRLTAALTLDSDLMNLMTALRFSHSPAERRLLRERTASDDLSQLFVGPGTLSFKLLAYAASQNSLEAALTVFGHSPYEAALQAGLEAHARSGRLTGLEKSLRRYRLQWMINSIAKDPLGIGLVLGCIALKVNEVNNLRWVAQGIHLGLKPDAIREEVEFVE
ncbi:MAG: V-type ATPase subunit [Chloroflexi bacterium]|nr:V-type ATPase subunit [Chloroflexota bacterium]